MEKSIYDKMVKRTVLYSFLLWFVLFIFGSVWGYHAYADFKEIQTLKQELSQKITEIQQVQKVGMKFSDFKKQDKSSISGDKNLENIVRLIEKDFYQEHFQNNSSDENYNEHIAKKIKEVDERMGSEEQKNMQNISSTVLPSFSDFDFEAGKDFSELKFVNYVERIMQTFNLEYKGEIGIADVLPVIADEDKNTKVSSKVSDEELLANKIFYIPLTFSIVGNKASIIDFMYFIENVGKVNIDTENLGIYVDDFFKKGDENHRNNDLVLDGDIDRGEYNIFLNQMVDIESIVFEEYIYEKREGDTRSEFVSNVRRIPQGLEEIEAEVTLRFYIKGISDYKVEKKYKQVVSGILEYSSDLKNSQKALSSLKAKQKTPEIALLLKRLVSYEGLLKTLETNMKKYKNLESEQIYKDILTSLELERMLKNDLETVSSIAKIKIQKFEEEIDTEK